MGITGFSLALCGAVSEVLRGVGLRIKCVVSFMPLCVGCLDAPPTYQAPRQIPPAIIESFVEPPLDAIVELLDDESMRFVAPFRSEDLNEPVLGQTFVDLKPGERPGRATNSTAVPASVYEDESRSITGRINADEFGSPGCHSVTLIAAHESEFAPNVEPEEARQDRITWWVHVRELGGRPALLQDCVTERDDP